ncbi:MAG: acylphosphatase [Dehalococcoidia bacterium]
MSSGQDTVELHVLVHGRVQGVFFRQSTKEQADRLGVSGWVRNLPDGGTVKVLGQGPRDRLEQFLEYLSHGPPGADVRHIEPEWRQLGEALQEFRVVP